MDQEPPKDRDNNDALEPLAEAIMNNQWGSDFRTIWSNFQDYQNQQYQGLFPYMLAAIFDRRPGERPPASKKVARPTSSATAGSGDSSRKIAERVTSGADGRCPVERHEKPLMMKIGSKEKTLTEREFGIISVLCKAYPRRLSMKELAKLSGWRNPNQALHRLTKKDGDWKRVLYRPGGRGRGGYGFKT